MTSAYVTFRFVLICTMCTHSFVPNTIDFFEENFLQIKIPKNIWHTPKVGKEIVSHAFNKHPNGYKISFHIVVYSNPTNRRYI